jgi:hypothetical protein
MFENFRKAPLPYILYVTGLFFVFPTMSILYARMETWRGTIFKYAVVLFLLHGIIQVLLLSKNEIRIRKRPTSR